MMIYPSQNCLLFTVMYLMWTGGHAAKRQQWLGPTVFMEGTPPSPRQCRTLTAINGSLYIFGDQSITGGNNDLYQFDPARWKWTDLTTSVTGIIPAPRYGHGTASDGANLYIFGGVNRNGLELNDMYNLQLRSLTWQVISPGSEGGPKARHGHGMAMLDGILYVFGGGRHDVQIIEVLNDLYAFDTATQEWTELSNSALGQPPDPRLYCAFAAVTGSLYVLGGYDLKIGRDISYIEKTYNGDGPLDDFFRFNLSSRQWTKLLKSSGGVAPPARSYAAFTVVDDALYLTGGLELPYPWDLYQYNISTAQWRELGSTLQGNKNPGRRSQVGFAAVGRQLYLFGGRDLVATLKNDLYMVNLEKLTINIINGTISSKGPSARADHGMASTAGMIYVFGGSERPGYLEDLYELNPATLTWKLLAQSVEKYDAREGVGLVAANGKLYLFGGQLLSGQFMNDVFWYDLATKRWSELQVTASEGTSNLPAGRSFMGLTAMAEMLYVFGGWNEDGFSSGDFYRLDLISAEWLELTNRVQGPNPPGRMYPGFANDRGNLWLFGGNDVIGNLNDLHMFDPVTMSWTEFDGQVVRGTPPRSRSKFGFASSNGKLFIFGGLGIQGFFNDLHEFDIDSMAWREISLGNGVLGTGPSARSNVKMVISEDRLFIFGGKGTGILAFKSDLFVLNVPRRVSWSSNGGLLTFLHVFDWDSTFVQGIVELSVPLALCVGFLPCTLIVSGDGIMLQKKGGYISCSDIAGCTGLTFNSVQLTCTGHQSTISPLQMQGAALIITNSTISGCGSAIDGGVVHAHSRAVVTLISTLVRDSWSAQHGGAVSAVGSSVFAFNTTFVNCSASFGGGAIWVSAYQCYGSTSVFEATLHVDSCTFRGCNTDSGGGAILTSADSSLLDSKSGLSAHIISSDFAQCNALSDGGGVLALGSNVVVNIVQSRFTRCRTAGNGGGLSVTMGASLTVLRSSFMHNTAAGSGGGAMHARHAALIVVGAVTDGNAASNGGGGALFWHGDTAASVYLWCTSGSWSPGNANCSSMDCWPVCLTCGSGKYQSGEGSLSAADCLECPAGTYTSVEGASACIACAAGLYSVMRGANTSSTCIPCSAGRYGSGDGATACLACSAGTYSSTAGGVLANCLACSAGSYSTATGATGPLTCVVCAPGALSRAGDSRCAYCQPGAYLLQDGEQGSHLPTDVFGRSCEACAAGAFARAENSSACDECAAGSYAEGEASECTLCRPGTYSNVTGATDYYDCLACQSGTVAAELGSTECTACEPGYYAFTPYLPCQPCLAGTYSTGFRVDLQVTECLGCPGGKYSMAEAASSPDACVPCDAGTYARDSASECDACVAGSFSTAPGLDSECPPCAAGSFAAEAGATACEPCPTGTFSEAGATACDTCPAGGYAVGATGCASCAAAVSHTCGQLPEMIMQECFAGQGPGGSRRFEAARIGRVRITNISRSGHIGSVQERRRQDTASEEVTGKSKRKMAGVPHAQGNAETHDSSHENSAESMRQDYVEANGGHTYESAVPLADTRLQNIHGPVRDWRDQTSWSSEVRSGLAHPGVPAGVEAVKTAVRAPGFEDGTTAAPPSGWREGRSTLTAAGISVRITHESRSLGMRELCGSENTAAFGPCIASGYSSLTVEGLPTAVSPAAAGLPIRLRVHKRDYYGQTMACDSVSLLQVYAAGRGEGNVSALLSGVSITALNAGTAEFQIAVRPLVGDVIGGAAAVTLRVEPRIYAQGLDAQGTGGTADALEMASSDVGVALADGATVCPTGYVFSVDQQRYGSCTLCAAGTYSINPLAGPAGARASAGCFNCPASGVCAGGANVSFDVGLWVAMAAGGFYRLIGCPSGYALVNSIGGVFSHDAQTCAACLATQYVVNSSEPRHQCQICPIGAVCNLGVFVSGRVAGSTWRVDYAAGLYRVDYCPPGYAAVHGAAPSADDCAPWAASTYVAVAVSLPLAAAEFDAVRQKAFLATLVAAAGLPAGTPAAIARVATTGGVARRREGAGGTALGENKLVDVGFSGRQGIDSGEGNGVNSEMRVDSRRKVRESSASHLYHDGISIGESAAVGEVHGDLPGKTLASVDRRAGGSGGIRVEAQVQAENAEAAVDMGGRLQPAAVAGQLAAAGFPAAVVESVAVVLPAGVRAGAPVEVIGGVSAGVLVAVICLAVGGVRLFKTVLRQRARQAFLAAMSTAKPGDLATADHIPLELRKLYAPEEVVGRGAFGCVVRARRRDGRGTVAIKLLLPARGGVFEARELRHLRREAEALDMFSAAKCEHTVHLAGVGAVHVAPDVTWFVMEHLCGESLDAVLRRGAPHAAAAIPACDDYADTTQAVRPSSSAGVARDARSSASYRGGRAAADDGTTVSAAAGSVGEEGGPLGDVECIRVARSVLAALKVLHSDGVIHRDIKPANIMRCPAVAPGPARGASASGGGGTTGGKGMTGDGGGGGPGSCVTVPPAGWDGKTYVYKLIDFGTALGVDETLSKQAMATIADNRPMGAGTPPYMSPEMFTQAEQASYPTDIWSLGVTLFESATGRLPFEATSDLLWSAAIAGDMDADAPSLLDRLDEARRARFDHSFTRVVARALRKRAPERFQSADEMHEAVYECLIDRGEAFYSCFVSYRVASEAPLARLLFDELNHSVTPGGHRVTVYWDAERLVKGQDWEEGFSRGLLNSLCVFPLLSYGATAPMADLPAAGPARQGLLAAGWDERPCGRTRLRGEESDPEDNVLKEFIIAGALLDRCETEDRAAEELGILQAAFPVLIGRMQPHGLADYPCMTDFFQVQGGGGKYPPRPSPPSARAAGKFLREKAQLPPAAVAAAEARSVAAVVQGMTALQGCQLWAKDQGLEGLDLHKDQLPLVGSGYAGPPVNLRPSKGGGVEAVKLTEEQQRLCTQGLDLEQLRMLKLLRSPFSFSCAFVRCSVTQNLRGWQALVRESRQSFHEVIDRAVASYNRARGAQSAPAAAAGHPAPPRSDSCSVVLKPAGSSSTADGQVTCELVLSTSPSLPMAEV